jgi:6-phosphogluconolactonase
MERGRRSTKQCKATKHIDTHRKRRHRHGLLTYSSAEFGSQGGGDCLGIDWIRTSYPENTEHSDSVGLEHRGLLAELPSPTWLLVEDSVVYAPLEFNNEVVALKVSKSGEGLHLEPLSRVSVQGDTPTHLAVSHDASGKAHLLVACYGDGNVCILPLESDGSIGEHGQVLTNEGHGPLPAQECPHAHWILPLPDGRILSTDLGADRIHVHQWEDDRLRRTSSIVCAPGTGPRDMHLLPSAAGQEQGWRVAVVDEWSRTVDGVRTTSRCRKRIHPYSTGRAGRGREGSGGVTGIRQRCHTRGGTGTLR